MFQVDKIIESRSDIEQKIAALENDISDLRNEIAVREKELAEQKAFLPGLMMAQTLLSSNLPNKNEPEIIRYRAGNNVLLKAYSSYK